MQAPAMTLRDKARQSRPSVLSTAGRTQFKKNGGAPENLRRPVVLVDSLFLFALYHHIYLRFGIVQYSIAKHATLLGPKSLSLVQVPCQA